MRAWVLVGMMGAGKTTVGREFARRHGLRFLDCDQELIARTGVSIQTIFELEGEAGFRRRESALIDELTQQEDIVLATGGGAVLSEQNRAWLSERTHVIFIHVPAHIIFERTRHDRTRPLLQVPDPLASIEKLCKVREPLYRAIAHTVVEGGRGGLLSTVKQIEKLLGMPPILESLDTQSPQEIDPCKL